MIRSPKDRRWSYEKKICHPPPISNKKKYESNISLNMKTYKHEGLVIKPERNLKMVKQLDFNTC